MGRHCIEALGIGNAPKLFPGTVNVLSPLSPAIAWNKGFYKNIY